MSVHAVSSKQLHLYAWSVPGFLQQIVDYSYGERRSWNLIDLDSDWDRIHDLRMSTVSKNPGDHVFIKPLVTPSTIQADEDLPCYFWWRYMDEMNGPIRWFPTAEGIFAVNGWNTPTALLMQGPAPKREWDWSFI